MSLTVQGALPPTAPDIISELTEAQRRMLDLPAVDLPMHHVLHAGMYARTMTMPPFTQLIGAHIKVPTLVVTVGTGYVRVGKDWAKVQGYQVLPASANRKQAFITGDGPLIVTMLFPTSAKTVEEAEREFTDEHELLLSHRQDMNTVVIGDQP